MTNIDPASFCMASDCMVRSAGRTARARDWALGETILVLYDEPNISEDIAAWPGAVYRYPAENGRWNLYDTGVLDPAESDADLESACRGVLEYIARKELASRNV